MGRGYGLFSCLLLAWAAMAPPAQAEDKGHAVYMKRCFWCHGEEGRGDGPSAAGMVPRPRDLVRADYRIRSTPHGQLPTDEDLFSVITLGLPGTAMPGWEKILTEDERWQLVARLKSFSPRFGTGEREPLEVPAGSASAERGDEIFRRAKCSLCHGEAGRGDGGITTALDFEWGLPFAARDLTRGWTFKGGHEPRDIYLRITGGLSGTPMGPYRGLLSDQERWDLAHYVASLDREPSGASEEFVVVATHVEGEIPRAPDAPAWDAARPIRVPLAGQVTLDPSSRWWTPTAGSIDARALWNDEEIAYLLEWNDPTGPGPPMPDSVFLQFAARDGGKPYFLFGDPDKPVRIWNWRAGGEAEAWTATGTGTIESHPVDFSAEAAWEEGRWSVVLRRPLGGEPRFAPGAFVPTLFSVSDGANAEIANVRAVSTWAFTTLERPPSPRPWLLGLASLLGAVIVQLWILKRLQS